MAVGIGAGAAALLWLGQRRMLYFPQQQGMEAAVRTGRALGLAPWTRDGRFLGWRAAHSAPARARLVVLHGNAGSALDRTYFREAFQAPAAGVPAELYLVEYPGYGPRPGAPSEAALVEAALEAARAARRDGPGPVFLLGESLGSGVAALAAARDPAAVDGLLLVTPLASVPAVARRHYGPVPAWLVRDRYEAGEALARYPGPVGFLIAGRDEVVFADLGLALHASRHGPKRIWLDERASHNDVSYDPRLPRWREMLEFLLGAGPGTPGR